MKRKVLFRRVALLVMIVFILSSSISIRIKAKDNIVVPFLIGDMEYEHEVLNIQENMSTGWYAAIDPELRFDNAVLIQGDVNLILCDGTNTFAANGVYITEVSTLTIWA